MSTKTNKKNAKPIPQKIAVSTPAQAMAIFQDFRKNSGIPGINIPGSKAKYYSVQQIVNWLAGQNKYVHGGWLGRALHSAVNSGMRISATRASVNDQELTLYRASN